MTEFIAGDGDRVVVRTGLNTNLTVNFLVTVTPTPEPPPPPPPPPTPAVWEDLTATFPTNPTAQNPYQSPGRWATRNPTGITIHHTGATDPYALARACLAKAYTINGVRRVGLPTTQYHIFVDVDGSALLCVPLDQGMWHDHGGYPNSNISVGVAGYWHKTRPPAALVAGLARVVAQLVRTYDIAIQRVVGHRERALPYGVSTECPGWAAAPVGTGWRGDFDAALAVELGG